jgi:hypothetical protein
MAHLMAGGFSNIAVRRKGHIDGSFGCNWPSVIDKHKDSSAAIGMLTRFFNRPDIDIKPCRPAHDLVTLDDGGQGAVPGRPGRLLLRLGDQGATPTLDLSAASGTFSVVRYGGSDLPAEEGGMKLEDITGGGKRSLGACPESGFGNDYLFVVTSAEARPAP